MQAQDIRNLHRICYGNTFHFFDRLPTVVVRVRSQLRLFSFSSANSHSIEVTHTHLLSEAGTGYPLLSGVPSGLSLTQFNGLQKLSFSTSNVVISPAGLGPKNDCADEDQQQF
jgi:hypothetical protein